MAFYVPWLVDAARTATQGTGRQVIVQHDWATRGHGGMRLVELVVGHHTATPETAQGDYPSYNTVTYGREDLSGPLAHFGLGRSGNVYVIAAGLAFHAGASAYAGYVDLNDEALGIEAEDSGDGIWTPDQLYMYPRLVAACLLYMSRGVDRYCSHRTCATPPGRKPDPTGIDDQWMRNQAQTVLNEGFDAMTPEEHEWLKQIYHGMGSVFTYSGGTPIDWVYCQQYDFHKTGGDLDQLNITLAGQAEQLAALQQQVAELSDRVALDSQVVHDAAKAGTAEALASDTVKVDITVSGDTGPA